MQTPSIEPFQWESHYTSDEQVSIRVWSLDLDGHPLLMRVDDFITIKVLIKTGTGNRTVDNSVQLTCHANNQKRVTL